MIPTHRTLPAQHSHFGQPTVPAAACRLSLVIPVYNERETLPLVVARAREVIPTELELIVVDDGSTDGSREIAAELAACGAIDHLLLAERNGGKGTAVRRGLAHATGDIVAVQDADLEYDPADLATLIQPILDGRADAAFGSRFSGAMHRVLDFRHSVINRFLTFLSNCLTDLHLSDMNVCYKVVRRDLLVQLPLTATRFGFDPELTARLAQSGARIYEAPVSYAGRSYEEGKKITWKDGVAALRHIVVYNCGRLRAPRLRLRPFHEVVTARAAAASRSAA